MSSSSTAVSRRSVAPRSHRGLEIDNTTRSLIKGSVTTISGQIGTLRLKWAYDLEDFESGDIDSQYGTADVEYISAKSQIGMELAQMAERAQIITDKWRVASSAMTPLDAARTALYEMSRQVALLWQEGGIAHPPTAIRLFEYDSQERAYYHQMLAEQDESISTLQTLQTTLSKLNEANSIVSRRTRG